MKKILLPTDFSETARNALEYALNFYKGEPCTFYFLSIYTVGK
ncbi:MAG: universal stress protein, partial [Gillisia sp.]|nr:universal stress protein [Gillisia sp.]